jgi:hypothetical protein
MEGFFIFSQLLTQEMHDEKTCIVGAFDAGNFIICLWTDRKKRS